MEECNCGRCNGDGPPDDKPSLSDIRKKAWVTRRQKYGSRGNRGSYLCCKSRHCDRCNGAMGLIVKMHNADLLSEGQICAALKMGRVDFRIIRDDITNKYEANLAASRQTEEG